MSADWRDRHRAALLVPQAPGERAVSALMHSIDVVIAVTRTDETPDYVAAPPIGQMLISFNTLLACMDIGRLDAGSLSRWAEQKAEAIGWDMDRERMRD